MISSLRSSKNQRVLLLVHVEAQVADGAVLERLDDRLGVDQAASAGVHDHHAALIARERRALDEVVRLGRERRVEGDDVGLARRAPRVGTYVAPSATTSSLGYGSYASSRQPKPAMMRANTVADPARPHDAHGASVEVEAEQSVEREVALADPVVGAVRAPVQRRG